MAKKEEWEIKIEKYLPSEEMQMQSSFMANKTVASNPDDKVESLKVYQENNDPNVTIEVCWRN